MVSVSVIEAKYKRAKLNVQNTLLWSQLSDTQRELIQKNIALIDKEQCVIVYSMSIHYSWVVTNLRLIIFSDNTIIYCPFDMIKSVNFPRVEEIKTRKKDIDQLAISLYSGNEVVLFVENTAWHFVYSLLRFLLPAQNG